MMTLEEKQRFKQLQMKVVELEYSRDALHRISLEQDAIIYEQRKKLDALSASLAAPEWFLEEFGHSAAGMMKEKRGPDSGTGLWDGIAAVLRQGNINKLD